VFAREVKTNEAMIAALDGALLYHIDCEKGEGPELAKKYGIRGYPTFIAVNGKGEVTDSWIGYEGAEKWSTAVVAAKADRRTIAAKEKAFRAEPTLPLALALASHSSTSSQYQDAVAFYTRAQELDAANADHYRSLILMTMVYGIDEGDFTMEEVITQAEPVMASDETPLTEKLELALMVNFFASRGGDAAKAAPLIAAAWEASEGATGEEELEYRGYLEVPHALLVEKDTPKALEIYRGKMPAGWQEDPQQLNRFAWWCFENDINLAEAQELAARGIELAETDELRASILDTAAEICHARGNCEDALAKIRQAVALDPDSEHYQKQLARFEKAVEDKKKG
jgi:tetratricopeptide (TPR) repeat protein